MDNLAEFNNEELIEVYEKITQEISHLKECIIVEEEEEVKTDEQS